LKSSTGQAIQTRGKKDGGERIAPLLVILNFERDREDEVKKISRIIVMVFSILLVTAFILPIWEITLDAPQYPEGLGMNIWINKITGDLQTINGLNHYIGMKKIEPDSINELKMMPYFLGALIALGLIAGISGKKKLLALWAAVFIIIGTAGAFDFYMWEYDYGHNLDQEAAIKVPGMSYQPPLIGGKQLLNIYASSYPDTGGFVVIAAGIASILVLLYEIKYNKALKTNEKENSKHNIAHSFEHNSLMQRGT